jgi:Zn-dependent peptidase ImmA (M78 family)
MNPEAEGRAAADQFRLERHLGTQPLGDLVALIEQATGIDVAVIKVGADQHGLTMRDPARNAIFIAVASTANPMRQRSTLAHELGHVAFQDWTTAMGSSVPTGRSPEERRADAFARHLLIPIDGLREVLGERASVGLSTLSGVVQRFLVSPQIAAIALHQAGYIEESTKSEWMTLVTPTLAARFGWVDQYHALQCDSQTPRAPQRLIARATEGYLENVVSLQTIATLRGDSTATIEEEFREAGLEPARASIAWASPADLPDVEIDFTDLDDAGGAPAG